jgi:hypothetical protein
MEFQKEDLVEAIAVGSLLTCSVMGICVMTDIGFHPLTNTFSSFYFMILLDALSYTIFFSLGTQFFLNGVHSPKLSPLNCVCFLASTIDILGISVSIENVSLFLDYSYFFLYSSFYPLSIGSFISLFVASIVVAYDTSFSISTFQLPSRKLSFMWPLL